MTSNNNGGPSSHGAAARHFQTPGHCTAILTHADACARLQALGFAHINKLPVSGTGRIPSRGKGTTNTGTAVTWTEDGQALHWYEFTTGDKGTIFAGKQPLLSQEDSARLYRQAQVRKQRAEADKQALQASVAQHAQQLWQIGTTGATHAYVNRKQLSGLHNARVEDKSGALLVPMWVSGIGLVNLQRIHMDGTKLFLKGGRVKGTYSVIGNLNNAHRVLVCEGWATGCTLAELYGLAVVVTFNAGNLMPVCQSLRSMFNTIEIILAADDDRLSVVNVGRKKAIEAAEAVGATLLFPKLCRCCTCTDHNDAQACSRRSDNG